MTTAVMRSRYKQQATVFLVEVVPFKPDRRAAPVMMSAMQLVQTLPLLLLVCCAKEGAPATPSEVCKLDNDQQTVTFVAYLKVPIMVGECRTQCVVDASDTWDYSKQLVHLELPIGTAPLTMKALPPTTHNLQQISASSFLVHASDGTALGIGTRVRVTGKLRAGMIDIGQGVRTLRCAMTPTTLVAQPSPKT